MEPLRHNLNKSKQIVADKIEPLRHNLNKSKQIVADKMEPLRHASCVRVKFRSVLASKTLNQLRVFLIGFLLTLSAFAPALTADEQRFKAEAAELIGGASEVSDGSASGNNTVGLNTTGDGIKFTGLPAASKLAIHYASVTNGTI